MKWYKSAHKQKNIWITDVYDSIMCPRNWCVYSSLIQFTFMWREIYSTNNNKPKDLLPAASNGEGHRAIQSYMK
jgi:hypothetical protein